MTELTTEDIVKNQTEESVMQSEKGVVVRLGTLTCPCGRHRSIMLMYRCLYCKVWFCDPCAEAHFGKTVEEYRKENPLSVI